MDRNRAAQGGHRDLLWATHSLYQGQGLDEVQLLWQCGLSVAHYNPGLDHLGHLTPSVSPDQTEGSWGSHHDSLSLTLQQIHLIPPPLPPKYIQNPATPNTTLIPATCTRPRDSHLVSLPPPPHNLLAGEQPHVVETFDDTTLIQPTRHGGLCL